MKISVLAFGLTFICMPAVAQTLPEWKLGATPQLAIGAEGSAATEFQNVRSVWRLSNGNVVVVNPPTRAIRIFNAKGAYLSSFGRHGQGPGEFEFIEWVGHGGDTAIVFDGGLRRI